MQSDQHLADSSGADTSEPICTLLKAQLPVELVPCILMDCFPDEPRIYRPLEDVMNIYKVRLVSRWWKELIEETPWFWFHISIAYPTQVIQDSLRRSKDHYLRVHACQITGATTEACESFLRLVQTQSHRWLSLVLEMWELLPEELVVSILRSPAPGLQYLTAVFPPGQFTHHPVVDLMSGTAQHLKGLQLCGVPIVWDFGCFKGLEDLTYVDIQEISSTDVVELLTRTSPLRLLVLGSEPEEMQDNASPVGPRASAPSLAIAPSPTALHLNFLSIPRSNHILTSFLMPELTSLHLDIMPRLFSDLLEIEEALAQFLPKIRRTLRSCREAMIIVDSNRVYRWIAQSSSSKDGFDFSFAVCGTPMSNFLEWIGTISHGLGLAFRVEMKAMDPDAWDVLSFCEDVTELVPMFDDGD
ncbi:hypothetical protein FS837_012140, partial [Tulasnella sp. UAMH 9824]